MMKHSMFLFAGLFAVACGGDKDGDTGDSGDDTGATGGGTYCEENDCIENEIDEAAWDVQCAGTVSFFAGFYGEASEAMVDSLETANANGWNDYHTLSVDAFADGDVQPYTELSAQGIATGVAIADWDDGVGTLFTCDNHYNDVVMTHVLRVYDLGGALADCVGWGDDVAGWLAGDYPLINDPQNAAELTAANCTAGTGAM